MKKRFFYIVDPLYGFIDVRDEVCRNIIKHRYFQRLRRITQTGLAFYVYPSATHNRFAHSLGVYHLMGIAINELKKKRCFISQEEENLLIYCSLLHDIGHGPFSHVLENVLIPLDHEKLSLKVIDLLAREIEEDFSGVIKMLTVKEDDSFMRALIASQMDMDRLDYLGRDSFFTGVAEGTIGQHRILKTLSVLNGKLAIEEKALLSIENFLHARMVMYKQVYLHKTVLSAEVLLIKIIERARELINSGVTLPVTSCLLHVLRQKTEITDDTILSFLEIDEAEIWSAIKQWRTATDRVLSCLCESLLLRRLYKAEISINGDMPGSIDTAIKKLKKRGFTEKEIDYFIVRKKEKFTFYDRKNPILVLRKDGSITEIHEISPLIATYPESQSFVFYFYPQEGGMLDIL